MKKLIFVTLLLFCHSIFAKDYIIFNISQDLPMGEKDEVIRKNYYINMGEKQGISNGTKLNVYRRLSKFNPYDNKKRISYKVKVGELEVIHSDNGSSIARSLKFNTGEMAPITDLKYFMIGDNVSINVK